MFRKWIGAGALAAMIAASPAPAAALEMGLTPNEVYGLWASINKASSPSPASPPAGRLFPRGWPNSKRASSAKKNRWTCSAASKTSRENFNA